MENGKRVVYCSGPMFSPEDHFGMQQIATTLENAGYLTYLPQRDGMELGPMLNLLRTHLIELALEATVLRNLGLWVMQAGFALDIYQLHHRADAVVFNMNGRVPDEGSVMETSSAFTAGKPVVIYKQSPLALLSSGFDNPMLQGMATGWKYAESMTDIPTMLAAEFSRTSGLDAYQYAPTPQIARVVELGGKVWLADEIVSVLRKLKAGTATKDDLMNLATWLIGAAEMFEKAYGPR